MKDKESPQHQTTFPDNNEEEEFTTNDELGQGDSTHNLQKKSEADELEGILSPSDKEGLPRKVLEADKEDIDEGRIVEEAFDRNIGSFVPDMMFEQMVKNFKNAEKLFGQTLIRELSGYDPKYIDKNIKIPEFQRELKKRIKEKTDDLTEKGIIKESGLITLKGIDAAALFLMDEEFEISKKGFSSYGEKVPVIADITGDRTESRPYKKGDKYKDIAIKQTVTCAIKRGRTEVHEEDLHTFEREANQQINIIYAIDASGSMRGEKLRLAKKAGVSLANRAIKDNNKVGLVAFGSEVDKKLELTNDFYDFVKYLTKITPGQETNIALAISQSTSLLHKAKGIKHIVLLTDGLHTTSDDPEKEVLTEVLKATSEDITISVVGISLDTIGLNMAQKIVNYANGKLYSVKDLEDMRGIIIADYAALE